MNTQNSVIFVLGVIVLGAIAWTGITFPKASAPELVGTAGNTFTNAKYYGISVDLSAPGTTGTTSSVTNTDSNDRFITGVVATCEQLGTSQTAYTGTGLAALTLKVGTSTSATLGAPLNPWAAVASFTIATATQAFQVSSSTTQLATSSLPAVWHPGEILVFSTNATNTAKCTFGVTATGS